MLVNDAIMRALQGINVTAVEPPISKLIAQPPADHGIGDAAMLHYTWGSIFKNATGQEVWKFDKRFYTAPELALTVRSQTVNR
jgi:hypothetical protein